VTLALSMMSRDQWFIALDGLGGEDALSGIREIIRKFTEDTSASQAGTLAMYGYAALAKVRLQEMLDQIPTVADVTTTNVPLPADTIRAGEIGQYDLYYVAAVLLAVIAWLLTFAGPVIISKLPQADQPNMTDYYSGIPGSPPCSRATSSRTGPRASNGTSPKGRPRPDAACTSIALLSCTCRTSGYRWLAQVPHRSSAPTRDRGHLSDLTSTEHRSLHPAEGAARHRATSQACA
jgi:hypothetical protein